MCANCKLLPAQRRLIEVGHDELTDVALYQGGVGSGKTTAGVILGYLLSRVYPGSRGLVGASTHTLLRDTTRQRWAEIVPKSDIRDWRANPDNLVLRNGSEIWFRHLSDPARLSSMEFNWIHVDEGSQVSASTFLTLLARLRHTGFRQASTRIKRRFRLFITTNPEEDFGYLYETFIEPESPKPNFRFIQAPTSENEYLLREKPDYIDLIRKVVDRDYASVYLDGETGGLSRGRVYRNFNRKKDVSEKVAYDPALPLHLSFDFNVDFMIALVIQERHDDCTWAIDEVVIRNGSSTDELCDEILERYGGHGSGVFVHGDASGYARHHRTSLTDYAIIRLRLGQMPLFRMRVRPGSANPLVRDRTNAVNFRIENALGERRFKVSPRCKYLIKSLQQTRFVEGAFEKEKIRDPKDPRFVIDHAGDATDYYIADEHPFRREQLRVVPYL